MLAGLTVKQLRALPCQSISVARSDPLSHYDMLARWHYVERNGSPGPYRIRGKPVVWSARAGFSAGQPHDHTLVLLHDGARHAVLGHLTGLLVLGEFRDFESEMVLAKLQGES